MEKAHKLEEILNTYLKELKDANNSQTRGDALLLIGNLVQDMNMYLEYKHKVLALEKYIEDSVK